MVPIQTLVMLTKYCGCNIVRIDDIIDMFPVVYQICAVGLALKTFKFAHEVIAMVIFCCNYLGCQFHT